MSNIEWTQETWQVTSGCSKVSAGCAKAAGVPVFVKQLGALVIEDEQRWSALMPDLPLPPELAALASGGGST